jgi:hypothetical protein
MKIFWPVTVQTPSAPSSAAAAQPAMSEPASGSVMSMQPQALPAAISRSPSRSASVMRGPSASKVGASPRASRRAASPCAMPPWKPWCAITDTSARAKTSLVR